MGGRRREPGAKRRAPSGEETESVKKRKKKKRRKKKAREIFNVSGAPGEVVGKGEREKKSEAPLQRGATRRGGTAWVGDLARATVYLAPI